MTRPMHAHSVCRHCTRTVVSPPSHSLSTPHRHAHFSKHSRRRPCRGLTSLQALQLPSEKAAGQVQGVEDEAGSVLKVNGPALHLDTDHPRRRLLVSFNCNKCGERSSKA
ncbi:hypothetical protein WJX73_001635 [Symbiochloris irregularis]|uniref:Uncharacterized protein n=1 Tax=Symbiochloris irregularis TaxID=706552 RepID=A0AAW1PYM6_9CHLO